MKCPACAQALSEKEQSGLKVDICDKGCGGIWFDNFELNKVDEAHESAGEALLDISPHNALSADRAAKRSCPKCPETILRRHFFSVLKEVEIDNCPNCGGVWLDSGELSALRSQFKTEQERKQAADEYFSKLFGEDIRREAAKGEADMEAAQKFAKVFRFICPSYWIPGKQKGGAF